MYAYIVFIGLFPITLLDNWTGSEDQVVELGLHKSKLSKPDNQTKPKPTTPSPKNCKLMSKVTTKQKNEQHKQTQ